VIKKQKQESKIINPCESKVKVISFQFSREMAVRQMV